MIGGQGQVGGTKEHFQVSSLHSISFSICAHLTHISPTGNYIQLDPISQVAVEKHQIIGLMLGSTQSSAAYGRIGSDIEVIKWPDGGKSRLTVRNPLPFRLIYN